MFIAITNHTASDRKVVRWSRVRKIRSLGTGMIALLAIANAAAGQSMNVPTNGSTASQNFNSIGTSGTAALPSPFRADRNITSRLVGTYSAAGSATEQAGSASVSTTATNGIYNFGNSATTSDRSIGFISSASATKSGNLYTRLSATEALESISLSYNVEKYRKGSNAAGFSIQLYYSLDDITYTSAGSNFLTSFAADADNTGYSPAPGPVTAISNRTLTFPQTIAAGSPFYLAFNYSVTTGATTSNAQGLGIDDFSVGGTAATPEATTTFLFGGAAASLLASRWRRRTFADSAVSWIFARRAIRI